MFTHTHTHSFSESLAFLYHTAHCRLPLPAAHVISHDPHLVALAVHALCDRDPTPSLPHSTAHTTLFPLTHPSVTMPVQFTKLLYAKLVHEQFCPPRNSGFTVPPPGASEHRSHDLGVKLVSVSMLLCLYELKQTTVVSITDTLR